jgi:hypothetical protein
MTALSGRTIGHSAAPADRLGVMTSNAASDMLEVCLKRSLGKARPFRLDEIEVELARQHQNVQSLRSSHRDSKI